MKRFVNTLSHELFDRPDTRGDRLYVRIVEFVLIAFTLRFCWEWGFYIQRNITDVLLPLGIAQYIDVSFMFEHYVAVGNAALVTLFLGLGFFRWWRPAYAIAIALFHLQYVARYCLGEISHGSNLVGMGILGLALAALLFSSERARQRFTMGFLFFFIGLGYTSAAVCKLIGTGITWPHGQHMLLWIAERKVDTISKLGAFDPNWLQNLILSDYHWGTAVLIFGLVAEACSFLMWWRRFRYPVILLVLSMHIGILITMNIFFWASTYLFVLLALPWPRLIDAALNRFPSVSFSTQSATRG